MTVLFIDMSSSVQTTGDMHPEDAATLVNRLLKAMMDVVLRYAGWVDRFLGDGILAVFGLPRAHESDPERAILAALEIRSAARDLSLDINAGINTGEVYVGGMGTDQHQVVTVMGPVVNLASRLQDQAEPGQILVGEATYRHTRRSFVFAPLVLELKGISHPVPAHAVERAISRPGKTRGIEGLHAELIGRDEELERLRQILSRLREGQGQMVALVGEAGVGKSRLVSELRLAVTGDPAYAPGETRPARGARRPTSDVPFPSLIWLEGRCLELGMNPGYSLFVDLFRDYFAQRGGEEGSSRGALLEASLKELAESERISRERAGELFPLLAHLLSIHTGSADEERLRQISPDQIKHQTFRAAGDFLVALARQQPVVLLLEDLHWADSVSIDLISFLLGELAAAPLCIICVYRPEPDHKSSQLSSRAAQHCPGRCLEIRLGELTAPQSRRLVESLLSVDTLPAAAWGVILSRARGNPFFVEEVVRSLIAAGMIYREAADDRARPVDRWRVRDELRGLPVPETVQSVILSRVDRLDRALKQILQCAAVIGPVFSLRVLGHLIPRRVDIRPSLTELEMRELIYQTEGDPDEQYAFQHVLTQETVYETLLRRRRTALHRKAAEAIVLLSPESVAERSGEIAEHYCRSDTPARAVEYLLRAGQQASRLYANQEARRYFERALECMRQLAPGDRQPRAQQSAHEGLGDILFRVGAHTEARREFQEALSFAPATVDPVRHAVLSGKLADSLHWQGQLHEAVAVAEAGLSALGADSTCAESVELREVMMRSCWASGDLPAAQHHADRLQRILPHVPYFHSIYMAYYGVAFVEIKSQEFAAAADWLQRMEALCTEHQNRNGLARCFHGRGDLAREERQYEQATLWFARSLELCEQTGDAHLLLEGHGEIAHLLILLDADQDRIEAHLRRWNRIAEEMMEAGAVLSVTALCRHLGKAYLERGDSRSALNYLRPALELSPPFLPDAALRDLEQLFRRLGRQEEFEAVCRRRRLGDIT